MKPTQHFTVSFRSMRTLIFKVLSCLDYFEAIEFK